MKIILKNLPIAAILTFGSFFLHFLLFGYGIAISMEKVSTQYSYLFFFSLGILPYSLVFRSLKFGTAQLYLDSFSLSVYILMLITLFSVVILPVLVAIVTIYIAMFLRTYITDRTALSRSLVFVISFIVLLTVAGLLRFNVYNPPFSLSIAGSSVSMKHVLVFSIYDNENPAGVPFYLAGGVIVQGMSTVMTFSVQSIVIYAVIASFLSENYYLIVSYVIQMKKGIFKGAASAASTALSCQCETISAALPGISIVFLSIASLLLLSEGFAVLLFTYLVISKVFKKGREVSIFRMPALKDRLMTVVISIVLIVAIPVIEVLGIELSLIRNLLFLLGISILMAVEGAVVIFLIRDILGGLKFSEKLYIPLILISSIMMFIWYAPVLLFRAGTIPSVFFIMNASSFASGVMMSLLYISMNDEKRRLFLEYTLMMFSMFSIVIFYLSVVKNYVIWPYFGLEQQTIFSIILVAISLPLTVLNTNLTLNSYASPSL